MFGRTTGELVWQGHPQGLREALLDAQDKEKLGDELSAAVMRASALYSYARGMAAPYRLLRARHYAEKARRLGSVNGWETLSHGQCDVIGTILLRRFLWIRPKPNIALDFFNRGLARASVSPENQALFFIGKAEAYELLCSMSGERERRIIYKRECSENIARALAFESDVFVRGDDTPPQAARQYTRVLRRAFVLAWKCENVEQAVNLYAKAKAQARSKKWGSLSQLEKIQLTWNRLRFPRFWHRFLPQ